MTAFEADPDWAAIERFLASLGAATLPHPGGTLLEHLSRVRRRLAEWQASLEVQAAGLCHAAYGTDGFPTALLDTDRRDVLAALIGKWAEELVYLYGSCERRSTYPRFGGGTPVVFRDRFTGGERTPDAAQARAFAEITAANELDLVAHNPEAAERFAAGLLRLLDRMAPLLSPSAVLAYTGALGAPELEQAPGLEMTRLDHLVLSVADIDRTIEFYERVLGMRAISFGEGRRALAFGSSKINLHQDGRGLEPHAARPTPGSADLCFITETHQAGVLRHLAACDIPVEQGPVPRTGALGPMSSSYVRDPDGNLIEISTYDPPPPDQTP